MQVQIDIGFEQLVAIAKKLPQKQWQKLKREVEEEALVKDEVSDFETLLLSGPVYSKKQLEEIEETRKDINHRLTKNKASL